MPYVGQIWNILVVSLFFFLIEVWLTRSIIAVSNVQHNDWCLYTLQNDHHNNSSYRPSPYGVTNFFLMIRAFKIYFLGNFQICTTISLTLAPMLHITSAWFIYFITRSLYLLTSFFHFSHPYSLPLVFTNLFSAPMSLDVLFFRFHI